MLTEEWDIQSEPPTQLPVAPALPSVPAVLSSAPLGSPFGKLPLPASGPRAVHEKVKKGLDQSEMRRKREATTVQIRKDKKEDSLQKRRRDVGGSRRPWTSKKKGGCAGTWARASSASTPSTAGSST